VCSGGSPVAHSCSSGPLDDRCLVTSVSQRRWWRGSVFSELPQWGGGALWSCGPEETCVCDTSILHTHAEQVHTMSRDHAGRATTWSIITPHYVHRCEYDACILWMDTILPQCNSERNTEELLTAGHAVGVLCIRSSTGHNYWFICVLSFGKPASSLSSVFHMFFILSVTSNTEYCDTSVCVCVCVSLSSQCYWQT